MRRQVGGITGALLATFAFVLLLAPSPGAEEFIEPRSGRLGIALSDLAVPAGPLAIDLMRVFQDGLREPGLLGPGWRLAWECRLAVAETEALLDDGGVVRTLALDRASGAYVAPTGERVTRGRDGRLVLVRRDGTTDLFDGAGRLAERDAGNGNRLTLRYGPDGRLARIDGPFGAFVGFAHDSAGRLVRAESHLGTSVRYVYGADRLVEVHPSSAAQPLRYAYDGSGRVTRIEDPAAGATELAYDAAGRVTARQFPDGSRERYEYDDPNRRIRHVDARGGVTTRQLSPDGRTEEIVDPLGRKTTVELDAGQRPVRLTDPAGRTVAMTYDALGRLTGTAGPGGTGIALSYLGATTLPTSLSRGQGGREELEYDGQRNLTRVRVDGETALTLTYSPTGLLETLAERGGRQRQLTYDAAGRLTAMTDSLGRTTRYAYDRRGNLVRVVDAQGGVRLRTYDGHDRLVAEADPLGGVTRFEYDAGGRLVRVVDPTGATMQLEPDAAGARLGVVDAAGRRAELQTTPGRLAVRRTDGTTEELRLDAIGRPAAVVDAAGRATRYDYDAADRVLSETSSAGRVLRYRYDERDRPVVVDTGISGRVTYLWEASDRLAAAVDPTGATERYRYDPRGRLAGVVDALGRETRLRQDAGGRLAAITTPAGETAQYAYDAEGRLVESRDAAGRVTRYEYDALDNVVAVIGPDGTPVRQAFDRGGRRTGATDQAGRTTRFAHDAAGRLLATTLPDGRTVRYRYGPAGDLLEVDDGAYPLRYDYDAGGRLVAVGHAALGRAVRYRYDAAGRLVGVAGTSGHELGYRYDGTGRLVAITLPGGGQIALGFDAGDRLQSVRYPNGVAGEWQYDAAGRIARIVYRGPGPPGTAPATADLSLEYRYDRAGNLLEQRGPGPGGLREYRYDPDGRLTEEQLAGEVIGYGYRAGGDRTERRDRAGTATFQYDPAGRLLSAGPQRFSHDAVGNLTRRDGPDGATQYEFDAEGRLVRARTPRGDVTFGYAPTGERVSRRGIDGTVVRYVHDGANLLEELAEDGTLRALYVHAPGLDRPLAMVRDGQAVFYHPDALGTVRWVTDAGGQVVASYEVDAFGSLRSSVPTTGVAAASPFVFAGREYDPDLGLYYLRARYYDPALGRFLSPDPLLGRLDQPETLNRYAYARNAPTRYVDPLGLSAEFPQLTALDNLLRNRPAAAGLPGVSAPGAVPAPAAGGVTSGVTQPGRPYLLRPPGLDALAPPAVGPAPPTAGVGSPPAVGPSPGGGSWAGRAWDFLSKPRGPFADPKVRADVYGDVAKGAVVAGLIGVAVSATDPNKTWGDVLKSGVWAGLAGAAWGGAVNAIGEATKRAVIAGLIGQTAGTVGGAIAAYAGPVIGAIAGAVSIKNYWDERITRGNAARKELADNMRQAQQSPALTPDRVNRQLARLRTDLATLRQLRARLGAAAAGPDPLGPARAKVAELEALPSGDPGELRRACGGVETLVRTLRAAATQIGTHSRAATRILGEAGEWPQAQAALQTAFSQMELGAQAATSARTTWEQARPTMQSLGQASGQAAATLHAEAMRLIATARAAPPGAAGASTADLNAFRGLKASLLVHTRAMKAAVGFHQVVATSWADFRDIELEAAGLDEPKAGDLAVTRAEQAAALEVRADAALAAARGRPQNPCDGYGPASPADAQTQWDAIRQAAEAMTGAAEARAQRLAQDLAKRQGLLGEAQAEAQRAQARGRQDLVAQARQLEQELRTTIQSRQAELAFIGGRLGPVKQALGGLGP